MTENLSVESTQITDPFQRAEERALINLLPPGPQASVLKAYKERPELFGLTERELLKILDVEERGPGPTANALRMKFWVEYDEAQAEHRNMKPVRIYAGICEPPVFYRLMQDPQKCAWILTRPASYEASIAEMHQFALSRLRKILEIETKQDSKMGKLQLEIFATLDNRLKGSVVQKTMNVHATLPNKSALPEGAKKEELERRLAELERANEKQQGKIIDARVVTTE
jgi:hypothetical protein